MDTDKPKIVAYNGETGETTERDMTQEELDALFPPDTDFADA